jgi:hypothetical protein
VTWTKLPDELRREQVLTVRFTRAEREDLAELARQWGVPAATIPWVLTHDALTRWRKRGASFGSAGIALAGACELLRQELGIETPRREAQRRRAGTWRG